MRVIVSARAAGGDEPELRAIIVARAASDDENTAKAFFRTGAKR